MSFSQTNMRPNAEPEYLKAFLTTKNGNSTRRLSTCTLVNLQLHFFSVPICLECIFMCSITPVILFIARLLSLFEKKLLRSDKIVVPLFMTFEFGTLSFCDYKVTHFQ